jgi:GNAT superfamily N-acetyltransferase
MIVRNAMLEGATAACHTIRRSIVELCVADHHNDPDILRSWLSNKTPDIFKTWVKAENSLLVAIESNELLAVGCATGTGEITLNYVSPDARFRGISSALLIALEQRARSNGNESCTLESTATARRFYLARGYSELKTVTAKFGTAGGHLMKKAFAINNDPS